MNKQTERKIGQDRIAEKVIYKRELNHSYMVLPCQDKDMAERYDYRIMQHNRIGGLLPCSLRYLDGEELLYYDITSRQPLARLYESRRMKAADLERIIRDTAGEPVNFYAFPVEGIQQRYRHSWGSTCWMSLGFFWRKR